jgi:DNA-binding transcriptional ArsR family regulator
MINNMVKQNTISLDATFSALSDPTRRAILSRLAEGPASVTEIAAPFDISLPAVSKHLRVLEQAGLMRRQVEGRVHTCHLNAAPLREATGWLAAYRRFWEGQLDSLAQFLEETRGEDES